MSHTCSTNTYTRNTDIKYIVGRWIEQIITEDLSPRHYISSFLSGPLPNLLSADFFDHRCGTAALQCRLHAPAQSSCSSAILKRCHPPAPQSSSPSILLAPSSSGAVILLCRHPPARSSHCALVQLPPGSTGAYCVQVSILLQSTCANLNSTF